MSVRLRIVDANFNRLREGLRVLEEIVRFGGVRPALTGDLRELRHRISTLIMQHFSRSELLGSRNTEQDPGREFSGEPKKNLPDLLTANCLRVAEAFRTLEEVAGSLRPGLAEKIQALRFSFYRLEKELAGTAVPEITLRKIARGKNKMKESKNRKPT